VPAKKLRAAVIEADWCTIVRENPTGTPDAPPAKPEDGNPPEGSGDEMNIAEDVGESQASRPKKKFILRGKGEDVREEP
jgi:hypothetical protein